MQPAKTGQDAVKRRKRIQRAYTSAIAVVSTCAVAYTIDMNGVADKAIAAEKKAAGYRTYSATLDKHIAATEEQYTTLLAQYNGVVRDARKQQVRMLADLRAAREAARKAEAPKPAATTYSTIQTYSGAPSVSAAAPSGPSSGTS